MLFRSAAFSCPPLPTLNPGEGGATYLSFSLWVTDPLWMVVSRCHNSTIVQAAVTLLSQNPQQQGLWHEGPKASPDYPGGEAMTSPSSQSNSSSNRVDTKLCTPSSASDHTGSGSDERPRNSVPQRLQQAEELGDMAARTEWMRARMQVGTSESKT